MPQKQLSVLLLCYDRPGNANTILDHIQAFSRYSRHKVRTFNPLGMSRNRVIDLNEFDAVVIHYSLVLSDDRHVSPDLREKLRRFSGAKIQFIQDEYRWVDRATAASREVGIDVLFTAASEPAAGLLYDVRLPGVRRVHTLTGYVPENLVRIATPPLRHRSIDVGYRGRDLPFWLGRLTQEKKWIAQGFRERASEFGLRTDIGWREADRIYGAKWIDFIASCRATLGTESGASIADFDGSVERAVLGYLGLHPGAQYGEVYEAVLRPYEGNVVVSVISPRVFEAAALGTGLVMFPGEYSGIVSAGEHYIVLQKDFSNMAEVAEKLKDEDFMTSLVERSHEHVVRSGRWSYASFIREFDEVVVDQVPTARGRSLAPRHRLAKIERSFRVPPPYVRVARVLLTGAAAVRGRDFARRSELESGSLLPKGWLAVRAALGDADLRSVFLEGRRARMRVDELLEEILDLSLLRRAAAGTLAARERFTVGREFDSTTGALRFISTLEDEAPGNVNGALAPAWDALHSRVVTMVVWDHRAVGRAVRLRNPSIEIGIGSDGLRRFDLLLDIGRRRPALLERALAPMIGSRTKSVGRLS